MKNHPLATMSTSDKLFMLLRDVHDSDESTHIAVRQAVKAKAQFNKDNRDIDRIDLESIANSLEIPVVINQ